MMPVGWTDSRKGANNIFRIFWPEKITNKDVFKAGMILFSDMVTIDAGDG